MKNWKSKEGLEFAEWFPEFAERKKKEYYRVLRCTLQVSAGLALLAIDFRLWTIPLVLWTIFYAFFGIFCSLVAGGGLNALSKMF